eukprot:scaffold32953_cov112-Isochrysis_galbana.AAC.1
MDGDPTVGVTSGFFCSCLARCPPVTSQDSPRGAGAQDIVARLHRLASGAGAQQRAHRQVGRGVGVCRGLEQGDGQLDGAADEGGDEAE